MHYKGIKDQNELFKKKIICKILPAFSRINPKLSKFPPVLLNKICILINLFSDKSFVRSKKCLIIYNYVKIMLQNKYLLKSKNFHYQYLGSIVYKMNYLLHNLKHVLRHRIAILN